MLCVVLYENRVCNANVTLPQKKNSLRGYGGVAFGDGPVDVGPASGYDPYSSAFFRLRKTLHTRHHMAANSDTGLSPV